MVWGGRAVLNWEPLFCIFFYVMTSQIKRIGIIGGGQLAWMMADAARKLDVALVVQTPQVSDPAVAIAEDYLLAPIGDAAATARLAAQVDVVTFENEFVDLVALSELARQGVDFRPRLTSLEPLLDKYHQRCFFRDHNLPTPEFASPVPALPESFPTVLKTRRMGYDGQGTFIVKTAAEYTAIVGKIGAENLIQEAFVPFERELAVMAARSITGEVVIYPIVETEQQNQVCRWVIAPAQVADVVQQQIQTIARKLLETLDIVGIIGIELFLTADDRVWVNEIAPRTHNSGHYSLDACVTSQFEQQLRAVAGLSLGDPSLNCVGALMVNLLGFETATSDYQAQRDAIAALPQTNASIHVHWYGKQESRPGRKLGHVTVQFFDGAMAQIHQAAIDQVTAIEALWQPVSPNE